MTVEVVDVDAHVLNVYLRMPFRFGIATLTAIPDLFVRVALSIDGETHWGVASENLPPRWFTKRPEATIREELTELVDVATNACSLAREVGSAPSVYDLWRLVYDTQKGWASGTTYPPLLWTFGVTLVERAAIASLTVN